MWSIDYLNQEDGILFRFTSNNSSVTYYLNNINILDIDKVKKFKQNIEDFEYDTLLLDYEIGTHLFYDGEYGLQFGGNMDNTRGYIDMSRLNILNVLNLIIIKLS